MINIAYNNYISLYTMWKGEVKMNNGNQEGKGPAIASLVLGIIAIVFWFFGYSALVSVICGIIGLICANASKNAGFEGGIRTAGFVCSLIGLIGGAVIFIGCILCVGGLASIGAASGY